MEIGVMIGFWCLFLLIVGSIAWSTIRNGISPMPTTNVVRDQLLASLPKYIHGSIIELGAGWGNLAFPLARRYPDSPVIAYENSWVPYLACRLRALWGRYPNLLIIHQNFYEASLEKAGLVVCYLHPEGMRRLKDKFIHELDKTALIVSHTFAIPGWKPCHNEIVESSFPTPIYHYHPQKTEVQYDQ